MPGAANSESAATATGTPWVSSSGPTFETKHHVRHSVRHARAPMSAHLPNDALSPDGGMDGDRLGLNDLLVIDADLRGGKVVVEGAVIVGLECNGQYCTSTRTAHTPSHTHTHTHTHAVRHMLSDSITHTHTHTHTQAHQHTVTHTLTYTHGT